MLPPSIIDHLKSISLDLPGCIGFFETGSTILDSIIPNLHRDAINDYDVIWLFDSIKNTENARSKLTALYVENIKIDCFCSCWNQCKKVQMKLPPSFLNFTCVWFDISKYYNIEVSCFDKNGTDFFSFYQLFDLDVLKKSFKNLKLGARPVAKGSTFVNKKAYITLLLGYYILNRPKNILFTAEQQSNICLAHSQKMEMDLFKQICKEIENQF